jgi:hypothetical protein
MARTSRLSTALSVAGVAMLVAGAAGAQWVREARYATQAASEGSIYLTSGSALRALTKGYNTLAADVYWIRTLQHYGGTRLRLSRAGPGRAASTGASYPLLYPLLDVTTTLDPRFNIAYRFGAIFLAEAEPGGAGRPDLAIALLEKGLNERPDKWEYMQDIGFVHYWWRNDYPQAADWFSRAADVPGAPWFLRSLAATTLAEGGDRRSSRIMWEAIGRTAENEWLRRDAERRLLQLRAMDDIDALQGVVDRYVAARGSAPPDWAALVREGLLRDVGTDPTGTPYDIDPSGRVRLSRKSALFPLPEEPRRLVRARA